MDMNINEIWDKTLISIKNNINSPVGYNVHIKSSIPVSLINSIFTISVPTSINKNIIEFRYKNFIESSLEKVTGQKLSLDIIVGENSIKDNNEPEKTNVFNNNEIDLYAVNPKYTFDNFVVGSSNSVAYEAAKRSAEYPGQLDNPLFIYGNSGLGKTHLMYAIGNKIKEKYKDANIICVPCERFTNEFIVAIREKTTDKFRSKYRSADVLLVDDVQFLEHKEAVQEEFFHTFNELFSLGKQIVITSDRRPGELKTLTTRMKTRFGQGFTIDISLPNYETRIAILQNKALAHNVEIDEEILGYIADHIRSSIRELEGALLNVISMSEIKQCDITMEFVKTTLESIISSDESSKISPKSIIQKVSLYYNISENDITGKIKTKEIALPRQVAMYLCRKLLSMNDTTISKEFSKDRTTVKHNIEKIESEINTDESLNSDITYITRDLESM
ncbi:MAG: chromosomal replication initiator protein DnaA [Oscillospiraceae bacterium]|nr:chromosomal replication initiator protein DnaA [Oscillospiraceae bacterium]